MAKNIKQTGIIEKIDGNHIQVRIGPSTSCIECKVAHSCNSAESKEKVIDVYSQHHGFHTGQRVYVSTSISVASYSIIIGFVLPLFLLLAILFIAKLYNLTDELSALLAISSLLPYYFLVWLFRHHIKKQITFQIEEYNLY